MCQCHLCNSNCNARGGIRVYFRSDGAEDRHIEAEYEGATGTQVDPNHGVLYIVRERDEAKRETLAAFPAGEWVRAEKY